MTVPEVGVTRRVLADQVKEQLLEGIFDGTYTPNSRIVETSVAKSLGTSQAPVREALRALEALGLVEILPFRGARVRLLDSADLLEAYVVRSTIEELGARLAVPRMTDDDIEEVVALVEEMHRAATAGDSRTVAAIDARFHGRIIEMSGNAVLLRVWRSLEPFSRTYITMLAPGSDPVWSADLHDPILDALRRRDTEEVVRALHQHFAEAQGVVANSLSSAGPDEAEPTT
jgi:DNA-binding GntR family transcriptional regulator